MTSMENGFLSLVKTRQSVRRYSDRPVEKERLELCLEAARLSPSASNSQPWKFVVVDDPGLKEKVARQTYDPIVTFNRFTHEAPVLVVIVLEKPPLRTQAGSRLKKKEWRLIDLGIAAGHFCLQAAELGLGTCMLGWFNEKPIRKLLGIPETKIIGLIISLGYPPVDYPLREKTRKKPDEVICRNAYR